MNRSRIFKIVGAVILGLTALFWLIKGITDLIGGVNGGIQNLIFSIVIFCLLVLSWKWALWGGISTALLAVVLAVYFNLMLPDIYSAYIPLLFMCAPMAISGLLFIEADWTSKKRN
jgi:hypothetical protein